jgi:FMN phosphatase YigB (HAD superfamily)
MPEIEHDEDVIAQGESLRVLSETCRRHNVDMYLFSNAPYTWCSEIMRYMHADRHVPPENIITSDHEVFNHSLKPDRSVYLNMFNYLYFKKYEELRCMMVDDSFTNLMPLIGDANWEPVLFSSDKHLHLKTNAVHTLHDLRDIAHML